MAIIDMIGPSVTGATGFLFKYGMRLLGVVLSIGFYAIVALHAYAYFEIIAGLLKKRLGLRFGLVWIAIGFCLLYNVIFNHFFAMVVKPGGPADLLRIEKLRQENKQREHRKAVRVVVEDDDDANVGKQEAEDDRFDGLQKDVKQMIKYRSKTMSQLKGFWSK